MANRFTETLTEMPDLPKEFGDDGGHFYRYYDELAEESDEDLVNNLKAQLDGLLIFAGLFAGVNSTFLALTLPYLSADPADDTNALLLQIALSGNGTITSAADLPSASFTPSSRIYLVNGFFSMSLMLALFSSLLAVLGQQWIVYYRKRGGGGHEDQRWERLRRYLGAKRWRLERVLDDLVPSLLQLGLVIFCIAFALYLSTINQSLSRIIVPLSCVAAVTILVMSMSSAFDPWCPFKQPLSRIGRPMASAIIAFILWLVVLSFDIVTYLAGHIIDATWRAVLSCCPPTVARPLPQRMFMMIGLYDYFKSKMAGFANMYRRLMLAGIRPAEDSDDLKVEALRRVMCTSENRNALIYAAVNLRAIRDERTLSSLGRDVEFCIRLSGLQRTALRETQRGQKGGHYSSIESRLFATSFFHILFSTYSAPRVPRHGLEIRASESLHIPISQIVALCQGSVIALKTNCDQCSRCAPLLFSIRVVYTIVESVRNHSPPDLNTAFQSIVEASTGAGDLRLGSIVASVMLFSKRWNDEEPAISIHWPHTRFLRVLFAAYRETSDQKMFQTIFTALATVNTQWSWKPNYEIYVWLFELCTLHGRKEIWAVGRHEFWEHVDDHLLSIESRIREKDAWETDRQRGRDCQNRYVQSIAKFFHGHSNSSREMWSLIGEPLERFLNAVKELMEADPGHPENPRTMVVLQHIKSSFPEPEPFESSLYYTYDRWEREQPKTAFLKFRQHLEYLESIWARKAHHDLGLRSQRLSCVKQRGETWCNQEGHQMHVLAL